MPSDPLKKYIGTVDNVQTGQQTASSNDQRLQVNGGTSVPVNGKAVIRASPGNSGTIYVGDENVDSSSGMPLQAEEDLSDINIEDLSDYYVFVVSSGDGFAWFAETG